MFETQSDEVEEVSWFQYWLPLLVSIGSTPIVALFVGITSMEGDYFNPNLAFPYAMVSARFFSVDIIRRFEANGQYRYRRSFSPLDSTVSDLRVDPVLGKA